MKDDLIWGQGQRLLLRQAASADLEVMSPWLRELAANLRPLLAGQQPPLVVTLVGQQMPVGVIAWAASDEEEGWFTTRMVTIDPGLRGRGLGGDAVLTLKQGARNRHLAERFRGIAPTDNGLALYFWLRLGYRPASIGPMCDGRPALWMVRQQP